MILILLFLNFDKAVDHFNKKMFSRAKKEFLLFVKNNPDDPRVPMAYYYIARLSSHPDTAIKYLKVIINRYKGSKLTDDALLYLEKIYYTEGRYRDAIDHYRTLRREYPGSPILDEAVYFGLLAFKRLGESDSVLNLRNFLKVNFPSSFWLSLLNKMKPDSDGRYVVQFGAFKYKENAEKLKKTLSSMGVDAYIVKEGNFYKVRGKRFSSYKEAKHYIDGLRKKGIEGRVVKL